VVGIDVSALAFGFALAAALLAAWLAWRFPAYGPRTVRSGLGLLAFACLAAILDGPTTALVQGFAGPGVALFCVDLPLLVFAFWTAGQLVRLFVTLPSPFKH
jgi:hypothetical protein